MLLFQVAAMCNTDQICVFGHDGNMDVTKAINS